MRAFDFITELNMSPGVLRKFAAGPIAANMQAGFEAELIIPGNYDSDNDGEDFDWDQDSTLPSNVDLNDVADYFDVNRWRSSGIGEIESNYQDWYLDRQNDWIEENLDDRISEIRTGDEDEDEDELYDTAREQLEEEFNSDPDSHDAGLYDFFRDQGMRTWSDVYESYSSWLDWPHMKATSDFEPEVEEFAQTLQSIVNQQVVINTEYHGTTKKPNIWYIEPDVSIDPEEEGYMGAELVSPPMPIQQMLIQLTRVLNWAKGSGAMTNESTGLHVGVSLGTSTQNVDYVKLALFLGDQYVLQQFGRQTNTYTKSSARMVQSMAQRTTTDASQYTTMLDNMRQGLMRAASQSIMSKNSDRYVSINMREGYIEFRSMGGDYLNNIDGIVNTVLRYIRAYAVAADPNAERKEYAKKLAKMINPTNNDYLSPFVQYATGDIDKKDLVGWLANRVQARKPAQQPAQPQQPSNAPHNFGFPE